MSFLPTFSRSLVIFRSKFYSFACHQHFLFRGVGHETNPASLQRNRVQSSVKSYLKRNQEYDQMMEVEKEEFEKGRNYLAQAMGQNPKEFNQEKVDEAIKYLLPSALFSHKARPKLKPPEEVYPPKKKLQCDSGGRPFHDMYYTRKPLYYNIMQEAVYVLEDLKNEADRLVFLRKQSVEKKSFPEFEKSIISSDWLSKDELEQLLQESLSDIQYNNWLNLMNRIATHPQVRLADQFIQRFRTKSQSMKLEEVYPEPFLDVETNRKYIISYGQKKNCFAEITAYVPGFGSVTVNEKRLLEVFPNLGDREQIMFPLQQTRMLGRIDVIAKVTGEGSSSLANALRLAIARALASLLPPEEGRHRLHICGLLTQDDRFAERKQSGQKKARKKPIWKAR